MNGAYRFKDGWLILLESLRIFACGNTAVKHKINIDANKKRFIGLRLELTKNNDLNLKQTVDQTGGNKF
jgi:hypothetical protein